jgi:hypothetical protein
MDKITEQKLIQRLGTLAKLKDHPSANDYGRGSADMARLFVSILTSRSNSMEFRGAMETIKSKAKSAEITIGK